MHSHEHARPTRGLVPDQPELDVLVDALDELARDYHRIQEWALGSMPDGPTLNRRAARKQTARERLDLLEGWATEVRAVIAAARSAVRALRAKAVHDYADGGDE